MSPCNVYHPYNSAKKLAYTVEALPAGAIPDVSHEQALHQSESATTSAHKVAEASNAAATKSAGPPDQVAITQLAANNEVASPSLMFCHLPKPSCVSACCYESQTQELV